MSGDEAGCYQAYSRYYENIRRLTNTITTWKSANTSFNWSEKQIGQIPALDLMNPLVATVNMAIPFLVSIIEDYFRSSYVAILRYSNQKEMILKNSRLQGEDLILLSTGEQSVEELVARTRSFQNLKKINESFKQINKDIDLYGLLNQSSNRRKKSTYTTLEQIINLRHEIIHRAIIVSNYTPTAFIKDVKVVHTGIEKFYLSLIGSYNWSNDHPDLHMTINSSKSRLCF